MPGQPGKPLKKPGRDKKMKKNKDAYEEYVYVYGPVAPIFDSVNTGSWRILRPEIDHSLCIGCGQCKTFCPTDVIEILDEGESGKIVKIDWGYCKGCGICANVCPKECIEMVEEKEEK